MDCEYGARLECGREGAKAPKARRAPEPAARASVRGRRRALGRKKDRRLKAMACSCGIWLSVHLNEREHSAHLSYPKNSRERCLLKRVTNKRVRKKLDVPGFAGYRRVLDFWWMLD
jgi:hypothetical protein